MRSLAYVPLLAFVSAAACSGSGETSGEEDDLTSQSATLLELSFHGEVVAPVSDSPAQQKKSVTAQLFYMAGELAKVHQGHGQFGYVEIDNVQVTPEADGLERITYDAKLPVAWPRSSEVPETYRVVLPLHVDEAGLTAFNSKYAGKCGAAEYGEDALWYDFEPVTKGCAFDADDAVDTLAHVKVSPKTTTDKRPEYERFWDDGEFRAVIVFGTDSADSKHPSDVGVHEYLALQDALKETFPGGKLTSADAADEIYDDSTFEASVAGFGGKHGKLIVSMLLTAPLKEIDKQFDRRFADLSANADLLTYGGHSGLSKNILAFSEKATVTPNHYQVYFIDGCNTFAYLDSTLVDRRIEANGADDDPFGTKYLDLILNAQPAPWTTGAESQLTVLRQMAGKEPLSYMDLLGALSQSATPIVSGEEDNPSVSQ